MENFSTTSAPNIQPFINESVNGSTAQIHYVTSGPFLDKANEQLFMSTLFPAFIYTCVLMGIGIPGNILVLYVYGFKWNKSTSRIFILALSAFDLINCLFSLTIELFLLVNFIKFDHPALCRASRGVTSFINNSTTVVLVAISVDRYIRICQPHSSPINVQNAKRIVYFSLAFALMTSWPLFVLYGTTTVPIPIPTLKVVILGKTCLIDDDFTTTVYPFVLVIFLLTCHFASDVVFVVLYTLVGKAVFRQKTTRKSLRGKRFQSYESSRSSVTMDDVEEGKEKVAKQLSQIFKSRNKSDKNRKTNSGKKPSESAGMSDSESNPKSPTRPSEIMRRQTSKPTGSSRMHAGKTTFMLFLVTLVFVISFLPYCVVVILRYRSPGFYFSLSTVGKAVYQVILRSYFLNSVLNPVVYSFVSQQFRTQAMGAMKCLACRNSCC